MAAKEGKVAARIPISGGPVSNLGVLKMAELASLKDRIPIKHVTLAGDYLFLRWWAMVPSQAILPINTVQQFTPTVGLSPRTITGLEEQITITVTDYNASIGPVGTNTVNVKLELTTIIDASIPNIPLPTMTLKEKNDAHGIFEKNFLLKDAWDLFAKATPFSDYNYHIWVEYDYNYGDAIPQFDKVPIKIRRLRRPRTTTVVKKNG